MSLKRFVRNAPSERGIALVLALFLATAASAIAASLMYLSQTEIYGTKNYRVMTQARYGAEAGLHKALNYLQFTYTAPTAAQLAASYVTTGSPVTYGGNPVILSANSNQAANYPDSAQSSAFNTAVAGTLNADNVSIAYTPYAKLLSARIVNGTVVLSWEITSVGKITVASSTAEVEVSTTVERQVTGTNTTPTYGAFATGNTCQAMRFSGGGTGTYNSNNYGGSGTPTTTLTGGNVGTNGNLTQSGSAIIHGTLSTPKTGTGSCSAGGPNALTGSLAAITGGLIQLPQPVAMPVPPNPTPAPPTTNYNGNGQTLLNGASVGNVNISGGSTLTLGAVGQTSVINVNSFTVSGGSHVVLLGTVTLNVMGTGQATPIDFSGGTIANSTYKAANFTVNYAGTGASKLSGGSGVAMVFNAPNTALDISGNSALYGSFVAKTINVSGGAMIYLDLALAGASGGSTYTLGNNMLSGFTWKKS